MTPTAVITDRHLSRLLVEAVVNEVLRRNDRCQLYCIEEVPCLEEKVIMKVKGHNFGPRHKHHHHLLSDGKHRRPS